MSVKKKSISINVVYLNSVIKTCPLCGKIGKHDVIFINQEINKNKNLSILSKCLIAGFCFEDKNEDKIFSIDTNDNKLENDFIGLVCSACKTIYRPLKQEESAIHAFENWGLYFRKKEAGRILTFAKHLDSKIAIKLICDCCRKQITSFERQEATNGYYAYRIEKNKNNKKEKIYHFCNSSPNACRDYNHSIFKKYFTKKGDYYLKLKPEISSKLKPTERKILILKSLI